jgi:glycyl-tRNA synthetase beta chain
VGDLARVVWQEELGTLGEKTERVVALAAALAEEVAPRAREAARRAALLSKTDLTTEMIKDGKEFTTLQGVMGEAYARAAGESDEVARAIFEHYLPRSSGDRLPETEAGAIVSLADKMDTLVGCLAVGLAPTGAGDPFGLRRQAQGVVAIIADRGYEVPLDRLVDRALDGYGDKLAAERPRHREEALAFLTQRIAFWLEGEGLGGEVARAVLAVLPSQVVEARRRARALAGFREDPDFGALALGFKRVRNILKGVGETPPLEPARLREPAEHALAEACRRARAEVEPQLAAGNHREVLARMVALRRPIDAFYDEVLVMDKDPAVRDNRLALLKELSALFLLFADFSLMVLPGEGKAEG